MKLGLVKALGLLGFCVALFVAGAALVFPPVVLGVLLMVLGLAGVAGTLWGVEV